MTSPHERANPPAPRGRGVVVLAVSAAVVALLVAAPQALAGQRMGVATPAVPVPPVAGLPAAPTVPPVPTPVPTINPLGVTVPAAVAGLLGSPSPSATPTTAGPGPTSHRQPGTVGGVPLGTPPGPSAPASSARTTSGSDRGLLGLLASPFAAVPPFVGHVLTGVSHWFRDTLLSSFGYLLAIILVMLGVFAFATSERMNKAI